MLESSRDNCIEIKLSEINVDYVSQLVVENFYDISENIWQKHVYFFGFENKVYLTQQNQGNENNYMYFSETQNQQLKQGFVDIVNGQAPQTLVVGEPNQQVTTTTTQDATTPASPDLNERAQAIREILKQNQGFNEEVLNSIPDEEIIDSFVGNATNAQLAQSAMNLLEKYPNLK